MSRREFPIADERYVVVGWDPPLRSYFWQVYDEKDEERIASLEGRERTVEEDTELEALYEKYEQFGGEPLIADSPLGDPTKQINDVVVLQQQLKDYCLLPADLSGQLIYDKERDL
jgi:hypothetical protein